MFQFTIRDLFWITLIAAALIAWRIQWKSSSERIVLLEQSQNELLELTQFLGGAESVQMLITAAKASNQAPPKSNGIVRVAPSARQPKGWSTVRPVPDPAIAR